MTRDITLTDQQIRVIRRWADAAWTDADQQRMLAQPGSPQEAACLADQKEIEIIRELLRGN